MSAVGTFSPFLHLVKNFSSCCFARLLERLNFCAFVLTLPFLSWEILPNAVHADMIWGRFQNSENTLFPHSSGVVKSWLSSSAEGVGGSLPQIHRPTTVMIMTQRKCRAPSGLSTCATEKRKISSFAVFCVFARHILCRRIADKHSSLSRKDKGDWEHHLSI